MKEQNSLQILKEKIDLLDFQHYTAINFQLEGENEISFLNILSRIIFSFLIYICI